jgi:hypothetical protein
VSAALNAKIPLTELDKVLASIMGRMGKIPPEAEAMKKAFNDFKNTTHGIDSKNFDD